MSIVPRYIVAGCDGSMRMSRPDASSRSQRSAMLSASAPASASREMPSMIAPTCSNGWKWARSWNQASRGRTQRIRSGSTSLSSSHMHASTAVLPDPSTVYDEADRATAGRSLIGTTRAPGATSKAGVCVAGTDASR